MASTATATPKKVTKAKKPKVPAAHPQYKDMISAAITALKERGGSSRQAILKYIMANYKVGDNGTAVNARVKTALKAGVKNGTLKQAKGTGASGSFKVGEKKKEVKKPKKATKPKAAKPKKVAKPKKTPAKKEGGEKKAAKPKKAKTPKKKPAAKKSPKKAAKPKTAKPKAAPKAKKAKTPKKKAAAKKA